MFYGSDDYDAAAENCISGMLLIALSVPNAAAPLLMPIEGGLQAA